MTRIAASIAMDPDNEPATIATGAEIWGFSGSGIEPETSDVMEEDDEDEEAEEASALANFPEVDGCELVREDSGDAAIVVEVARSLSE
jgi:hypothetical protein